MPMQPGMSVNVDLCGCAQSHKHVSRRLESDPLKKQTLVVKGIHRSS